jgi:hypothetical protein
MTNESNHIAPCPVLGDPLEILRYSSLQSNLENGQHKRNETNYWPSDAGSSICCNVPIAATTSHQHWLQGNSFGKKETANLMDESWSLLMDLLMQPDTCLRFPVGEDKPSDPMIVEHHPIEVSRHVSEPVRLVNRAAQLLPPKCFIWGFWISVARRVMVAARTSAARVAGK